MSGQVISESKFSLRRPCKTLRTLQLDAEPLPGGCTVIVRPDRASNIVKTCITRAIGNTGSAMTGDYGRDLILD